METKVADDESRGEGAQPRDLLIGAWRFSPEAATLARGDDRRRLQHRAALVLDLMCRRAGELVSTVELIEAIWAGRAVSQNSVAVVIADLRRALGDDPRHPRYIETISKRGYRLIANVAEIARTGEPEEAAIGKRDGSSTKGKRARPGWRELAALLSIAAVLGVLAWVVATPSRSAFTVVALPVENATGDARNDALAAALTDLVSTELAAQPGVRVVRAPGESPDARVHGRLVLWTGDESLSLQAIDGSTGTVLSAAMAPGPARLLPRQLRAEMPVFAEGLTQGRSKTPPSRPLDW